MEEAIRNFPKQFEWEPKIVNAEKWKSLGKYILCGMGGSHLQGDIFQNAVPGFDLAVHQDYGLPRWRDDVLKQTLIIVSSYSGNTEEAISSFDEALRNGYPVAALSTGGDLLIRANQHKVPYIEIPDTGIQPRNSLGFTFKALAKMVGRDDVVEEATAVGKELEVNAARFEEIGKQIAEKLKGKIPLIYASNKNYSIAYNWKIKFNETAKTPAFYNLFSELNHNEMNGFDITDSTRELCDKFHFLFLIDTIDHVRIRKRMDVLERQLRERGFSVETISLGAGSMLQKIFSSLLTADWAAFQLATLYGRDPEQVPMIEEFKKLID
ncbi:MAG: bifunctional phosphoglucose/phosphomannose isomerase [Candidatus Wildermuthbacteria bacterium RIFCSPLOWO2_01_FULL_48_29]|uniref:Bifunctional phosphoglucose/phosphomannose isomerase n=2 Tax=Parcubacteria group TaxID=1794811 RepID=A0A1G2RL85_9BACT|nr:MAG: bifunctional phosphoglucose/phosphomannose isomerase [Candidatus Yanofskybacteria bacterium RIFCSPHIGHO2_01_FULL_48_25b]OHA73129.1 MAG: bifunctional phosphoglucose/phosphomannose isomerase [Candidatus Wildermuthbacteria bacterium RIFCSPLOWO2_01_FULL_48_29]